MFVNFNILNQLGSPAINSNTFANRPAAGQTGRLFVSTDTFEIYRDNGTTWDLIGGPGTSTITGTGTATQVAYFTSSQAIGSSANLFWDNTNGYLGINTATPGAELDLHGTGIIQQINSTSATANSLLAFQRSGSGLWRIGDNYNSGTNFFELYNTALSTNAIAVLAATNKTEFTAVQTYSSGLARGNYFDYNLNVPAGTSFSSPNAITALGASLDLSLAGSATIPSGARTGLDVYNTVAFTGAGTLTMTQGSNTRAYSNLTAGWAFNGSAIGTITHLAGLRVLFPDNSGSTLNVTNNYGLLINNQDAATGTITYTNRWGIYQEGASDLNYLNANLLLGSTTNSGEKLQVTGTAKFTGSSFDFFTTSGLGSSGASGLMRVVTGGTGTGIAVGQADRTRYSAIAANEYTIFSDDFFLRTNGAFPLSIGTNNTARLTIIGTGQVGISTNAPSGLLQLNGVLATPSDAANITIKQSGTTYTDGIYLERTGERNGYYMYIGGAVDSLNFRRNYFGTQSDVMSLNRDGNAGINTTTPQVQLDVRGASVNTYAATIGTGLAIGNWSGLSFGYAEAANNLYRKSALVFERTGGSAEGNIHILLNNAPDTSSATLSNSVVKIASNGNFLIGTTTDAGYKLSVNGNTSINGYLALFDYITPSNNYYLSYFYGVDNSYRINYNGAGNDELILSNTGNLQIGGSYKSATPNGGTAAEWKLGSRKAAIVALDTTQYIEVDIGGTLYKLAIVN